ncbi:hypothetical protein LEP1GSC125_3620 [Leptospira mayottensis 200901122]|uniref:Uncharacterized protein n=1 Tax=Leptospira mayottensis 200901122 TaxID=1193010 RepID=A0AA87MP52_9LEPT|nr:hypothetical protein LEP1GSC125_3620 [Leptospira mayottensis 200901122]
MGEYAGRERDQFSARDPSSLVKRAKSILGKLKSNTDSFESYWKRVGI